MRFDVTFKQLFRQSRGVLSHLLFGEVVEWPNVELPEVRNLRVDLLARSEDGWLRQVEVQIGNEAEMPFRMLEYYVALRRVYGEPIRQTVLYVGREPLRMEAAFVSESTRHEYSIVNLREMDGEELLASEDWADNEFALLTKTDPERVIRVVFEKLRQMGGEEQEKAAFSFAILSGIIGMEQVLEQRFQTMTIDLLENKLLGPAIRKGMEQGMAQGIAQERLEMLRDLLKARFGELPVWVEQKIQAATPEARKEYILQLHNVGSIEELLG
jgi:predicted transposase YdaD